MTALSGMLRVHEIDELARRIAALEGSDKTDGSDLL